LAIGYRLPATGLLATGKWHLLHDRAFWLRDEGWKKHLWSLPSQYKCWWIQISSFRI